MIISGLDDVLRFYYVEFLDNATGLRLSAEEWNDYAYRVLGSTENAVAWYQSIKGSKESFTTGMRNLMHWVGNRACEDALLGRP